MSAPQGYSAMDRALHRVAFAATPTQLALADIEDRLYPVSEVPLRRPVFVTSLARAGTTLLLTVLSQAPDFATHTYRNMPFVLCPLLWNRLSRRFRDKGTAQERSHGDGVTIDFDSPEAFEEVVWMAHWPDNYEADRIHPWSAADRDPDFEAFLRQHLRKIISLGEGSGSQRYLSKNNANIARLDLLQEIFPDASFIIPFRDPWDHARSLLRQHLRFCKLHREDAFSRRYMEWLGHFEFGAALRPIDFQGWCNSPAAAVPGDLTYWLTYWCNCYEAVLERAGDSVTFIDYDALCRNPEPGLARLASAADLDSDAALQEQGSRLRRPTDYGAKEELGDRQLASRIERVQELLAEAAERSVADTAERERYLEA